jgi:hypothetical protein
MALLTMEDSDVSRRGAGTVLLARFTLHSRLVLLPCTPSSRRLEPPRRTPNLSPRPVPRIAGMAGQVAAFASFEGA